MAPKAQATVGERKRQGRRSRRTGPTNLSVRTTAVTPPASLPDALRWAEEGLVAVEESCWQVLAVYERSLGADHSEVASIHRRLADAHQGRGRFAEAEAHLRKALAVRTAAFGARHPATAADQVALGQLLVAGGRFEEAEGLLRRALRTFQSLLGPHAPETVVVSRRLSALLERAELTASRTAVQ